MYALFDLPHSSSPFTIYSGIQFNHLEMIRKLNLCKYKL